MGQHQFAKELVSWFNKNKREMPWRETKDPYKIWISEIMLQQTQVKTVIPYFNKFIQSFPTVKKLANASQQSVLKAWEGLGYYTRARNLHKAAKIIARDLNGKFPRDGKALKSLPGVGDYTAAAIGSIAFGNADAVVDGNVMRVLSRVFLIDEPVNQASSKKIFQKQADQLLDPNTPGDYNESIMELGALVCTPGEPKCEECPISSHCTAYQKGKISDYPKRLKKVKTPTYQIAIGVVFKDGKLLITKRQQDGLLGGLWEFPGGKIEKGESAEKACVREMKEETNLRVTVSRHLSTVKHAYSHFKIVMEVFICDYISGDVVLSSPVDFRWIAIDEIDQYPFPTANHKFIGALKKTLTS